MRRRSCMGDYACGTARSVWKRDHPIHWEVTMPAMNQPMLLLLAPLSLLTGAALQILVSRFCSSRSKGVLAVLSCLPAVCAVLVTLAGVSYALREKASIWQKLNEITSPICIYHDALIGRRYCVENFGQFAEYWIHQIGRAEELRVGEERSFR